MKKSILGLFLCIVMFLNMSIPVYAKSNLSALRSDKFLSLSEQDKQDIITAITKKVIKDLNITREIKIEFYSASDWPEIASNTALPDTKWDTIRYNMSCFDNDTEAVYRNQDMGHFVVSVVAHEVRHTYQIEHLNDDTDYGAALRYARGTYSGYLTGMGDYYTNFIEEDANAFGSDYADKYLGKSNKTQLIANNGKVFDPVFYANTYPDVKNALGTDPQVLLNHYNTFGINENRKANSND